MHQQPTTTTDCTMTDQIRTSKCIVVVTDAATTAACIKSMQQLRGVSLCKLH